MALPELMAAARRRDDCAGRLASANADLRDAVRRELAAGSTPMELSDALGVTRQRIYQIRDGRR